VAATSKALVWAVATTILDTAQLQSVTTTTAPSALPSVTDPTLTHTHTTQRLPLDSVDTASVTISPAPTLEMREETLSLPTWALMSLQADQEVTLHLEV